MPELDGLEATRQLVGADGAPRVLILTTFDLDEYVYEAMKAGASGFLLKEVRPEQLADAVRVVAAGDTLVAPAITRRLIEDFVRRRPPGSGPPAEVSELTDRELEVLKLVAQALSNSEIAGMLFLAKPRSRRTSRTSWRSSGSAIACKRSCSPTSLGSSSLGLSSAPPQGRHRADERPSLGSGVSDSRPTISCSGWPSVLLK